MTATQKTAKTFDIVTRFHATCGTTTPCAWDAYAETLSGLYGADRATLEAMRRVGRFMVDGNGVRFSA